VVAGGSSPALRPGPCCPLPQGTLWAGYQTRCA